MAYTSSPMAAAAIAAVEIRRSPLWSNLFGSPIPVGLIPALAAFSRMGRTANIKPKKSHIKSLMMIRQSVSFGFSGPFAMVLASASDTVVATWDEISSSSSLSSSLMFSVRPGAPSGLFPGSESSEPGFTSPPSFRGPRRSRTRATNRYGRGRDGEPASRFDCTCCRRLVDGESPGASMTNRAQQARPYTGLRAADSSTVRVARDTGSRVEGLGGTSLLAERGFLRNPSCCGHSGCVWVRAGSRAAGRVQLPGTRRTAILSEWAGRSTSVGGRTRRCGGSSPVTAGSPSRVRVRCAGARYPCPG
jgi:hypothetical protein